MYSFYDLNLLSIPLQTKYADMVREAQIKRLETLRVNVKDMVHSKVENKPDINLTGSTGLTVPRVGR